MIDARKHTVAVHLASSDALRPAPLVAETIAPGDRKPPVPYCVAIKLGRDDDGGVSGATRGLAAFGLMEIETAGFAGDPRQLNGLMLDLAGYRIEAGPVIKDSDRIGRDAATKIWSGGTWTTYCKLTSGAFSSDDDQLGVEKCFNSASYSTSVGGL